MNWELTSPRTSVAVPRFGPRTISGASPFPRVLSHRTPSMHSASMSGCIGRLRTLASPVSTVEQGRRDATPAMRRMVVPEFRASMTASGQRSSPPTMRSSSPPVTWAPKALMASKVARVSSPSRGRRSTLSPSASSARAIARWV